MFTKGSSKHMSEVHVVLERTAGTIARAHAHVHMHARTCAHMQHRWLKSLKCRREGTNSDHEELHSTGAHAHAHTPHHASGCCSYTGDAGTLARPHTRSFARLPTASLLRMSVQMHGCMVAGTGSRDELVPASSNDADWPSDVEMPVSQSNKNRFALRTRSTSFSEDGNGTRDDNEVAASLRIMGKTEDEVRELMAFMPSDALTQEVEAEIDARAEAKAKAQCEVIEAQCEARCKDIEAAAERRLSELSVSTPSSH